MRSRLEATVCLRTAPPVISATRAATAAPSPGAEPTMLIRTEPRNGRHRRGHPAGQPMLLDVAGRTPRRPATSRGARWYSKNRLLVVASAVTGALALTVAVAGVTLGRFTTTRTSGTNTFATGTVTLANSAIANCPVTGLLPNNTTSSCTFTTSYSGSAPVYLAVDV